MLKELFYNCMCIGEVCTSGVLELVYEWGGNTKSGEAKNGIFKEKLIFLGNFGEISVNCPAPLFPRPLYFKINNTHCAEKKPE